jgi:hypothetical protein
MTIISLAFAHAPPAIVYLVSTASMRNAPNAATLRRESY